MVNISIDVTDLGGEARPGDKVVFWRPRMGGSATHAGRVISTAPVTVFLTDGKATVSDVEPGEMTVLLQCRGVESQGPVTVGVPDGDHTVTLRALLESQFEYAPPIVSAVQEAASNASASEEAAIQAQMRSEAAADRADAKVDDAINNGANLVRNEVKQDADRAFSARQAATQSESNAAASENAAASSASNAAASETNAKQSETNAGDYAAVATTAATEAVDAMDSVSDIIGAKYATQEYVDESKYFRGYASTSHTLDTMPGGIYHVASGTVATSLGLPRAVAGWLEVYVPAGSGTSRRITFKPVASGTRNTETWEISTTASGGDLSSARWTRADDNYAGTLSADDFYQNLPPGKYSTGSGTVAVAAGMPSPRGGQLKIESGADGQIAVAYSPSTPGTADKTYSVSTGTAPNNSWHGNWYATNQHRMRSSPIVLTQPALTSRISDKANYRQSQRIAFTCPTNVERIRVHVSARNYRTGDTWGGMTLRGIGIGEQTSGGQVRNLRTFTSAENVEIPEDGSEWVSEWETSFLNPGSTYLLTYGCDWNAAPEDPGLISCTNWSNSRPEAWNESGNSSGWVRYSLQPLDIWIECLAPSDVPVYSYFGTSLTMGMDSGESVFNSYPQIHARNNGAFCAQTAAGGWAVVDDTAKDSAIIGRFGDAGVSERIYALWGGSNDLGARGASVSEVASAIKTWAARAKSALKGNIYLQTTAGGRRYSGPDDPLWLKIEEMNHWLRHDAWSVEHITGVIDMHNHFSQAGEWWNQDVDFAYSDSNGHFNVAGHKRYALALETGYVPERENGKGALAAYMKGKGL